MILVDGFITRQTVPPFMYQTKTTLLSFKCCRRYAAYYCKSCNAFKSSVALLVPSRWTQRIISEGVEREKNEVITEVVIYVVPDFNWLLLGFGWDNIADLAGRIWTKNDSPSMCYYPYADLTVTPSC